MARTESLELLGEVVDQLGPLAQMSPGTPLRSAQWNVMVEAVRNLARLAASREETTSDALDESYARSNHEHLGQMGLTWFDPPTRDLLERGINGAIEQRTALQSVTAGITALRQSMEDLRRDFNDLRTQFDGLRDNDLARRNDTNRLGLRVEALRDVERKVNGFGSRMDSIATDLTAALDFRRQVVGAAGQPISIAELDQRVRGVETLRDNLLTANGQVVRIREIESTLARLESNSVGRDTLDEALTGHLRDGTLLDEAGLTKNLSDHIKGQLDGRFTTLEESNIRLAGDLNSTREALSQHGNAVTEVNSRLGQAEGRLGALAGLSAQFDGQTTRLATVEAGLQSRATVSDLSTLRTQLQGVETTANRAAAFSQDISQLTSRLQGAETRLAGLDTVAGNLQRTEGRITAIEQDLPGLHASADLIGQHTDQLKGLDFRLQASESQLDNLGALPGSMDRLQGQTKELSVWRTSVDQRLGPVEQALPIALEQLKALDARQATAAARIEGFSALPSRLERVEGAAKELSTWRTSADQRLGNVEQDLPQAMEQLKAQGAQLRQVTAGVAAQAATLDRLAGVPDSLASIENQTQDLTSWRRTTDVRLDDLSRRNVILSPLVDRVGVLEQSLTDVQNTNRLLRADVTTLSDNLGTVNRQVVGLQQVATTVNNLNTSFSGLETRLKTVELRRVPIVRPP